MAAAGNVDAKLTRSSASTASASERIGIGRSDIGMLPRHVRFMPITDASFKASFDPKAQVAVLTRLAHRDPSDRKLAHDRSDGLFEAVRRTTTAASDVEN
jgi:hypothetical protein